MDGWAYRGKQLLDECLWHLRNPSASEAMPVHWDGHRLNLLKRAEVFVKEFESEDHAIQKELDEQQ